MASRFQASILVSSPSYPNSIAWSDENLIAVACGHLVTILNPASPFGPRGVIKVPHGKPFPIGVIKREELLSGSLLPVCLSRDCDPCVRSISWSPLGMAPNSGCLLAMCTVEGQVKLYRPPFCDYCAEWIEVMDISESLYDYLASVNFNELENSNSELSLIAVLDRSANNSSIPSRSTETKVRRVQMNSSYSNYVSNKQLLSTGKSDRAYPFASLDSEAQGQTSPDVEIQCGSTRKYKSHLEVPNFQLKKSLESSVPPLISTHQYASRSIILSSLVISWSPLFHLSSESSSDKQSGTSSFSILAVGGKSGKLFFWKCSVPNRYSIEHGNVPPVATLVGFLQAHSSWITATSWAVLSSNSSNPQVLLVTGSANGSVRIWLGHAAELLKSTEVSCLPFILLNEIITGDGISVSVLSLIEPVSSPRKIHLAVGKVSGSFDVWMCDISSNRYEKAASKEAHDHAVTGFAWAFNGYCLYSCSQDNTVRSWMINGDDLCEVSIPSGIPGQRGCNELPNAFYSCFGLAVSPGNLMIAMVRSFDAHLLNPMYQARSYKAAVEYLWIGGQHHGISFNMLEKTKIDAVPHLSDNETRCWRFNALWSLKQYETIVKPLVVWDIVAALVAFKQLAPDFVVHILFEWVSTFCKSSRLNLPVKNILPYISQHLSELKSRQLHLLNVISRRVVLSESKTDLEKSKLAIERTREEEELIAYWVELVVAIEKELLERLVGFSFACSSLMSCKSPPASLLGSWYPFGLAQMEQWVTIEPVKNQLKAFVSDKRRPPADESARKEQCPYCRAPVPFESPDFSFCQGADNGKNESHKLVRCSVSMQVCSTTPLWFCTCCKRYASKLPPEGLFTMVRYPEDFRSIVNPSALPIASKPLCPFCGILLQRLQPEFLLSAAPV